MHIGGCLALAGKAGNALSCRAARQPRRGRHRRSNSRGRREQPKFPTRRRGVCVMCGQGGGTPRAPGGAGGSRRALGRCAPVLTFSREHGSGTRPPPPPAAAAVCGRRGRGESGRAASAARSAQGLRLSRGSGDCKHPARPPFFLSFFPSFFFPSFLPSFLSFTFLPPFLLSPSLSSSLSPSLLSSHPAPPLGSPRPPPSGAPIGRAPPTWASRRARDAGERCRCQRQSARGEVGSAPLLAIPSAVPIPKETGANARRATGNNGFAGCHTRTGLGRGLGREQCACASGGLRGAAAHPLGLRPLEPSGNGGGGGSGWSRRGGGRELFRSVPRDGSRPTATSAPRFASPCPAAAAPSPGRGFSGGDGAVSFDYRALCACAAGAAPPVPSCVVSRHRALAGTEGLRLKAPQFLGEAPGRRFVASAINIERIFKDRSKDATFHLSLTVSGHFQGDTLYSL
ncbi:translation initiation factor IF-2-like [Pyrgilauda ruficollis]|uniref:translation initiation factor IF-2-like n=1 Tax=Pyrgilauda ruficollis TaxID=221976 RepID=UPI001B872578|nr:translation initiation factor IF-2-like [Pyrgilauda ruficollis]